MPSMKDSSEPVETRMTRTPGMGSSLASDSSTATPVRLSFAPGTTLRTPMSAIAAA